MRQLGLSILRLVLPPFHPWKYRYINWAWGKQSNLGGWKDWQEPNKK